MQPRRLLLFAYDYPPSLVGVRRTVKFVKYLSDFGWRCGVITVRPVCASGWDDAPLREIAPARPLVRRTGSLDPYRLCMKLRGGLWPLMRRVYQGPAGGGGGSALPQSTGGAGAILMRVLRRAVFLPDDRLGWLPFAVAAGLRAAHHWKPHAIYSTSYPHTAHLAAGIVRSLTGIPWLADFRDGWTQNPAFYNPLTPLHAVAHRRLERWVARRADALLTVSPPITEHLQCLRNPDQRPAETLYNGFDDDCLFSDPERFREPTPLGNAPGPPIPTPPVPLPSASPHAEVHTVHEAHTTHLSPEATSAPPVASHAPFTLLYTGTFFGTRSPATLLEALATLAGRRSEFRDRARLVLHSALDPRWLDRIRTLGIESLVQVRGFVPHKDILMEQHAADALVLVVDTGPGSEIIVTQKVFEYLAAGKPILALAGPGACRDLLETTGGAALASPDDPAAAAAALERLFDAWLRGESLAADPPRIVPFHRREQTRRLAQILNEILE